MYEIDSFAPRTRHPCDMGRRAGTRNRPAAPTTPPRRQSRPALCDDRGTNTGRAAGDTEPEPGHHTARS